MTQANPFLPLKPGIPKALATEASSTDDRKATLPSPPPKPYAHPGFPQRVP